MTKASEETPFVPVTVRLDDQAVESLRQSFRNGVLLPDGRHLLSEWQVDNYNGLFVEIRIDEHSPPHFHVFTDSGQASYSILDCELLAGSIGKFKSNLEAWYLKNRGLLIHVWNLTRPANCSVGPIPKDA